MSIAREELLLATGCSEVGVDPLNDALNEAMAYCGATTPRRIAHFLATTAWESGLYLRVVENLNYSAKRLCVVWPSRFFLPPEDPRGRADASIYAGKPDLIASLVYAKRLGNGDAASGDGFTYRGRGFIQITGKDNYVALNRDIPTIPCITFPDALTALEYAALSAGWFWKRNKVNAQADLNSATGVCRIVNGGVEGLPQRIALTRRALRVFATNDSPPS